MVVKSTRSIFITSVVILVCVITAFGVKQFASRPRLIVGSPLKVEIFAGNSSAPFYFETLQPGSASYASLERTLGSLRLYHISHPLKVDPVSQIWTIYLKQSDLSRSRERVLIITYQGMYTELVDHTVVAERRCGVFDEAFSKICAALGVKPPAPQGR